jgi:hypothetical protein
MKLITAVTLGLALSIGAAHAQSNQSINSENGKQNAPATTGAMGRSSSNGVATDPQGVKNQQGDAAKAAPGTVGAAPGSTPSPSPAPK